MMTTALYTVAPYKDGYRIYLSHAPGSKRKHTMWTRKHFDTVPAAKLALINALGINPVRSYGTKEVRFNRKVPLHHALMLIEQRHNAHGEIMSVGPSYYTVRRTRFGIEEKISYKTKLSDVMARNDSEPLG